MKRETKENIVMKQSLNHVPLNLVEVIMRWVAEDPEQRQYVLDGLEETMKKMSKEIAALQITKLPVITKENSSLMKL